jgi:hypothetical protein
LNKGVALSFEDPGGFDADYQPHPESVERGGDTYRGGGSASGGSLEPPGPLLEPPLPTHLHTVCMAYSEDLPTRLNPLAERALLPPAGSPRRCAAGQDYRAQGLGGLRGLPRHDPRLVRVRPRAVRSGDAGGALGGHMRAANSGVPGVPQQDPLPPPYSGPRAGRAPSPSSLKRTAPPPPTPRPPGTPWLRPPGPLAERELAPPGGHGRVRVVGAGPSLVDCMVAVWWRYGGGTKGRRSRGAPRSTT